MSWEDAHESKTKKRQDITVKDRTHDQQKEKAADATSPDALAQAIPLRPDVLWTPLSPE